MSKYARFIKKESMPLLQLQDKKMPMIEILKQPNVLRFIHHGEGNEISAARTIQPLPSNSAAVYFQAIIKNLNTRYECGVGLIQKDCALKKHPGQSNLSIGYLSNGYIYINGKKIKKLSPYKASSVAGVGVIYSKLQVFFTLDGKLQESFTFEHSPGTWPKFYPCLSLRSQKDEIELQSKKFAFNFQQLLEKVEKQCLLEIESQPVENQLIYSLVGNFLKFNGYSKTHESLRKNFQFKQLNCFIEHPFLEAKLKLHDNSSAAQTKMEKKLSEMADQMDDQVVINRKSSTRQRIMSDYWGDILPLDISKKRNYEQQKAILQSQRKSSVISNLSNEDLNSNKKQNEDQEKAQEQPANKLHKFLLSERVEILQQIRSEKIQRAFETLQSQFPELLSIFPYLESYFLMQVYLRILKNDGANKAILYIRSQSEKFKSFKDQVYPLYCNQIKGFKFVPFSQMMGLVSKKASEIQQILCDKQFITFAKFVNEFILKNLGLYPESRLDMFINHYRCILNKCEQYQINGIYFSTDI